MKNIDISKSNDVQITSLINFLNYFLILAQVYPNPNFSTTFMNFYYKKLNISQLNLQNFPINTKLNVNSFFLKIFFYLGISCF